MECCADLPVRLGKSRGTTTVFNGKVYYGGGTSHEEQDQDHYIVCCYDPSQDKWTTLPPLPVKQFSLGQVNGKLVAIGGKEVCDKTIAAMNKVYMYDYQSQRWKPSIPMPTARYSPGVLSLESVLIVAGGEIVTKKSALFGRTSYVYTQLNVIEIFKSETSQWYRTNPLPTPC